MARGEDQFVVGDVQRRRIGEADLVQRQRVGHQPGGEAVDQAQQPFVGKDAAGGPDRQRLLFADDDDGGAAAHFELDREVVEDHAQEAGDALQRGLKSRR